MKELEEDLLREYFEHRRKMEPEFPSGLNERIMAGVEQAASASEDIFAWRGRKAAIWLCVAATTLVVVGLGFYLYYTGAFDSMKFALPKVDIKAVPISGLWVAIGSVCTVLMVISLYLSNRLSNSEQDF